MKRIVLLIVIFLLIISGTYAQETPVSTFYLIRHAEKMKSENPDPKLHPTGIERANKWAEIFKDIPFDAIYSTDYIRTRETAHPTAENHGLEITLYNPTTIDYEKFKKENAGKTVLIVGHSNTIPEFVNKLIGSEKYGMIDHNNNGNLYIVQIVGETVCGQVLYIE